MSSSYFDDVGRFHEKFGLPLATPTRNQYPDPRDPGLPSRAELDYRIEFMREELEEFLKATYANDLANAADALADLVWVALGTAHHLGLPFDQIWLEILRANMQKEVGPPDPTHKRPGERIRKPPGWRPPDHVPALRLAGWVGHRKGACDGDHGGPPCADPECWARESPEPGTETLR
jgi:predicted HAD superfamily Cof-like phosphohydrolase